MNKKILTILTAAFCLFFFSCSNGMFMDYMNYSKKPGSTGGGNGGGSGGDDFEEEPETTEGIKISANFKYILPNGEIDPSYPGDTAALQTKFSPGFASFYTANYDTFLYKIEEIDTRNIAKSFFISETAAGKSWHLKDAGKNEYAYNGADFKSKGQDTSNVTFYRYTQKNPFFNPIGSYNTAAYKKTDGTMETVMKRFMFFRWTGKAVVIDLDNYMLALDTYTGLIFPFIKITSWEPVMGEDVPKQYSPVENYTGSDGKTHRFYEYDPSGYVDSNGQIILYPWYEEAASKKLQEQLDTLPKITGKSPYYNDGSDEIDGIVENQNGYPVTGTLTVNLEYLKNISMTGTTLLGMGLDNAMFTYALGYSAYAGEESEATPAIILDTNTNKELKKGKNAKISKLGTFSFLNETRKMNFDLDAAIERVNGTKISVSTLRQEGGVPYSFVYDRVAQVWKHISGVTIDDNKPQEIIIPYVTADGSMELCYTVTWQREYTVTDKGNMLMPAVNYTGEDTQVFLSGGVNQYFLEYTDTEIDSANEHKMIELDLVLHNLAADALPIDIFLQSSNSNHFINNARLDGVTLVKRGGNYGTASIPVTFTLLNNGQGALQEGSIIIWLLYPSSGYDTQFSPKEITLNVKRKQHESE